MLTPQDVEQKTFSTALRGYDLDEVDDFLDEVVATIRDLQEKLSAGEDDRSAAAPSTASVDESAVGRALVAAQETADRIVAEAREQADAILAEAREEADTWISEKEASKARAEAEMAELSRHVANVRNQLAVLATAVADKLDEMDAALAVSVDSQEESPESGSEETQEASGHGVEETEVDTGDDTDAEVMAATEDGSESELDSGERSQPAG